MSSTATAVQVQTPAVKETRAPRTVALPPRKSLAWIKTYAAAITAETTAKKEKKSVKDEVLLAAGLGEFVPGDSFTVAGKTAFTVSQRETAATAAYWAALTAQYPAIAEKIAAEVGKQITPVFNLAKRN